MSTLTLPPPEWDDLSLFEQMALLPEKTAMLILSDLLKRGIDPEGPEVMLRPDQLKIVKDKKHWIQLFSAGRGAGKEVALSTPIPTPSGWTTMGALSVGDTVFDEEGNPTKVLAVYDQMSTDPVRLHFSDGTSIDAGAEHQWVTWEHRDRKALGRSRHDDHGVFPENWPTWRAKYVAPNGVEMEREDAPGPRIRTTQDIVDTLRYGTRGDLNHCIPLTAPLRCPDADLPIDPWLLGYWLGNGYQGSGQLSAGSKDGDFDGDHIAGQTASAGYDFSRRDIPEKGQSSIYVKRYVGELRGLGVLNNKHVPAQYLRSSERQRLALLRGLMDSDGYADPRKNGAVEFCSTTKSLAEGVLELARSLGEKPVLAEGRATLDGRDMGPKYRVTWSPTRHNPFSLPRKARGVDLSPGPQSLRLRHRMIVDATEIPLQPMRCITVDSPNSMYLAGEGMIPTHNTRTGAGWVNERAMETPGCQILLLGRTVSDVRDVMVNGASGIIATAPKGFVPNYTPSLRKVEWPNGSIAYTYSADSPDQLRGPQGHYAWADELAAYPTKPDSSGATAWDNCLMATRLGDQPQLLVTTTPKRTGVMRDLYRMAETDKRVALFTASTLANRTNLSPEYLQAIFDRYAGTHLEMQELYGELIGDAPGAMWRSSDIRLGSYVTDEGDIPNLVTVIGVDPSVEAHGDNTGIVLACGTREREMSKRKAWVMEDRTMEGAPDEWAAVVHDLWLANPDAIVVVEGNQGGQLLRMVLHQLNPSMPVAIVKAVHSKVARAEPIVMAYRQKRIEHVDHFPLLEEEMTGWEPGVSRWSPGSVDALVWAMSVLLVDERPLYPYMPVIPLPPVDDTIPSLVPAHRRDRSTPGMSVAPWRR